MPVQSRSARMTRTIEDRTGTHANAAPVVVATGGAAAPTRESRPVQSGVAQHHNALAFGRNASQSKGGSGVILDGDGVGPPAKRRKLAARDQSSTQTTLDKHFIANSVTPLRPSVKIAVAEPHGQLVETINGVQKELDVDEDELSTPAVTVRKQTSQRPSRSPAPAVASQQKKADQRTLRSQDDGPKLKSELSIYFPNYEELILDAPQETEFLDLNTTFYIVDDAPKDGDETSPAKTKKSATVSNVNARRSSVNAAVPPSTPQRSSSNQFNGSPTLNLDFMAKNIPDHPDDPLSDEHFLKAHRRAERREKQLRNIERERAMHEKVQLDRLLDGLQGHDWLRVLGITGITDGESRKYESKRDYFVSEVKALLDKFVQWREQEKKQRLEKGAAVAAKDADSDDDSPEGSVEPSSSDINASAARQLQQETISALKNASSKPPVGKGKDRAPPNTATPTPLPVRPMPTPSPEIPITSFYAKRHLRDAALGKARHGRNITAFGQPLPVLEEREFALPSDYVTEDTLRANARERRRRKRETVTNVN